MTDVVIAEVAGEITLNVDEVPQRLYERAKAATTVANEEREKAVALQLFGAWDMPSNVPLWREEARRGGEHVLCLPRGFVYGLRQLAVELEIDLRFDDRRSNAPSTPGYFQPFLLRDYQAKAVKEMIAWEQGLYECPAGGGKTVSALGMAALLQQRTIVIMDKANLMEQWRERASQFLGLSLDLSDDHSVGKIGDDVWEERDLTIALRQTLWSRLWQVDALDWFSKWGVVIFDEAHHLSSDTLGEVSRRVSSRFMFGVSATPAKSEIRGQIVAAMVGPVVAQTTRATLYARGVLQQPTVERVITNHEDAFWPTHTVDAKTPCEVPDCPKSEVKKHKHNHNYASCLKRLVEDKDRNILIAERIVSERGHVHLVNSGQLKHLDLMRRAVEAVGWDGPIYMLRGEENAQGLSQEFARHVAEGGKWELEYVEASGGEEWTQTEPIGEHGREAVIFSTIADEGMDIPVIDRVHITFPMRQAAATIQLVGRGERIAEGKKDSIIVDYIDPGCSVFLDQAGERERTYRLAGYKVSDRKQQIQETV